MTAQLQTTFLARAGNMMYAGERCAGSSASPNSGWKRVAVENAFLPALIHYK